jgi:Toxin SymE, type I toxin-antitoxin system
MCEPTRHSTSLPEPTGPFDDRFVYRLTEEGKRALAACERANGKPAGTKAPCTDEVAEALDRETRRERRRQRRKEAQARGLRVGTVCGRWQGKGRVPDLRMSGRWLEEAGFVLGREYEVEVGAERLTIRAMLT